MRSMYENSICYTVSPDSADSCKGKCRNPGLGGMTWVIKRGPDILGNSLQWIFSSKQFPALQHVTNHFPVEAAQGLCRRWEASCVCGTYSSVLTYVRAGA